MNKKFVLIIGLTIFVLMAAQSVAAYGNNITVTCPADGPECTMSPNPGDPLFYETNMLPGDTVSQTLTVVNEDPYLACSLEVFAYNDRRTPNKSDFPKKLFSTIERNGSLLLDNTIQDIYDLSRIDIGTIPAAASVVYDWTVTFDPDADNYYQLNETIFDFDVVFSCGDERVAQLLLAKTNNRLGLDNSPGDLVIYTLTVTAVTDVDGVEVIDLPPEGFVYQLGSWTAESSVRGNLKPGVTLEPNYQSPGTWQLGNMLAGEIVTLTYVAKIDGDQMAGIYPDLAWAQGVDGTNAVVRANIDSGFFVGTQVKVVTPVVANAAYSVEREGQVLGATTLPATGLSTYWIILASIFVSFGLLGLSKKMGIVAVLLMSLFVGATPIMAADLSIRLSQPESPTNQRDLMLSFVVLDLENRPVTVQCYQQGPGDSGLSAYGSAISIASGGTSGSCPHTSDVIDDSGVYRFRATAQNGVETVESLVVEVNYVTDAPDKPSYEKSSIDKCSYVVEFTTANDGKTQKVELFRSDEMNFVANDQTRIATIDVRPNQQERYVDTPPDCEKDYYYALRSVAESGSVSALVGDEVVTSPESEVVSETPTQVPARRVTQSSVQPPPNLEEGQILGEQSSESAFVKTETPIEEITENDEKTTDITWWWVIGIAAVGTLAVIFVNKRP